MSLSTHRPVKGITYGVVCPVCCNPMDFECISERMYGVRCPTCNAMIDLRNPAETLPDTDTGVYEGDTQRIKVVHYSAEVEPSTGMSASAQVNNLLSSVEAEKRKIMPTVMTGETKQAFSAQRQQALAQKFSLFFPVTHAIEYVVFGKKPYAKIGHVRIFRKRIPFYGYVNICAPQTTTSYSAPCSFTFLFIIPVRWLWAQLELEWIARYYHAELVLVFLFYTLLFRLAYSDPGYRNQRESLWEDVNGVPMERKWCSTCNMHRPVRAAHCYICGLCCYDHDHHCGVLGICVGRRRVEMFSTFVSVATMMCALPTMTIICALWTHWEKFTAALLAVAFFLVVMLMPLSILLTMTAVSMWQSITQEASTRERIQHVYAHKRNPYNRGFFKNLYYHLVQRRVAASLFDDDFVKRCALRVQERELGTGVTVTCI
ncbi:DHHC palmitoyltransferase family protein [Leishmania donovani]|uniref:Palmitoyltransferase n=1 Tax=Leishmania donovani TaxID=5661 RepID=A0A504Y7L9_LEIDO|nr:DHHC palmitoyltransferase family protein [Leishmania donovani]